MIVYPDRVPFRIIFWRVDANSQTFTNGFVVGFHGGVGWWEGVSGGHSSDDAPKALATFFDGIIRQDKALSEFFFKLPELASNTLQGLLRTSTHGFAKPSEAIFNCNNVSRTLQLHHAILQVNTSQARQSHVISYKSRFEWR